MFHIPYVDNSDYITWNQCKNRATMHRILYAAMCYPLLGCNHDSDYPLYGESYRWNKYFVKNHTEALWNCTHSSLWRQARPRSVTCGHSLRSRYSSESLNWPNRSRQKSSMFSQPLRFRYFRCSKRTAKYQRGCFIADMTTNTCELVFSGVYFGPLAEYVVSNVFLQLIVLNITSV